MCGMCAILRTVKVHAVRQEETSWLDILGYKFIDTGVLFPVWRSYPQIRDITYLPEEFLDVLIAFRLYITNEKLVATEAYEYKRRFEALEKYLKGVARSPVF